MSQSYEELITAIKWDTAGLVPAIVQDAVSLEVLTLAYMSKESLERTLVTRETWLWSRSRSELWHKGATSGHTQQVQALKYDCDGDALLVLVKRQGPACHTGEENCFYRTAFIEQEYEDGLKTERFAVLEELEQIIAQRDEERPEGAYTTYLFDKGIDKILKKVGEETAESIIAAKNKDNGGAANGG